MPKLTRLTPEQEARMGPWADDWIARGLSCEPADRALVEDGMRRCYEAAGLVWHGNVVWVGSPIVVGFAGPIAALMLGDDAVRGAVYDAVHGAVGGAVGGAVDDAVCGAVDGAVGGAVYGAVGGAVDDAVGGAVYGAVGGAVDDAVRGAVRDAVHGAVGDAVGDAVRGAVDGAWWRHFGGSWRASWLAWRGFFHAIGVELDDGMWDRHHAYVDANSAGWWWPHEKFVIVADRPVHIRAEQIGPRGWGSHRLHSESGPSVLFRDGWSLSAWHGIRLPETPEQIRGWSTDRVLREPNAEVRRAAIEIRGWDQFVTEAGLRLVDETDDPGNPGNMIGLYDVPAAIYETPVRVLLCTNGSPERDGTRRRFGLTVPAEMPDALSAAGWGYGLSGDEYALVGRRT